jgi:methyltransferase-like protein/cyclopropane fatty-acyl-phospholipid synthase-like methyltransferase
MSEPLSTSYDEIPYDSQPRRATHPDCLGTLATLLGMAPAPIDQCRVLELGCATGGNLIPQAATLPDSQFEGIDLSAKQIAQAQELADVLGLSNIQFKAASILDIDEGFGLFDYIICHGVFSWVPEPVRDKILAVCKANLAPQGVAFVSYNAYPGWHFRGPARELMKFHVGQFDDPKTQVQQARAALKFVARAIPKQEGPYARLLKEEAELLDKNADYYLFHEHLENENQPFYFLDFMKLAGSHGLQYLGEAQDHTSMADLAPEAQETLKKISPDLLHLEQYLDFLRNRMFRRTLLVHDNVTLKRTPPPEIVSRFLVRAVARPTSNDPDIRSSKAEEFECPDQRVCLTANPLAKAMLVALYHSLPQALTFDQLAEAVSRIMDVSPDEQLRLRLPNAAVEFYLNSFVDMHLHLAEIVVQVSERPLAHPLTRRQAATDAVIATRRHTVAKLNRLERAVLSRLDGTQDHEALLEAITHEVIDNGFVLERDGEAIEEPAQVRQVLKQELPSILDKLAANCLLIQ